MSEGFELTDDLVGACSFFALLHAAENLSDDMKHCLLATLLTLFSHKYPALEKMPTEKAIAVVLKGLTDPRVVAYMKK